MKINFFLQAALACLLAIGAAAETAAYEPLPEDLRLISKKGIDAIYAVDLEEALKQFNLVLQKYPEHPFPHFGIAMAKWAHLEYLEDESDPKLEKEYGALTDKAVDVGLAWIKKHPGDANAYLAVGGIYGLRARLAVLQHRWFKAYFDGKKGINNTRKAVKIDPALYDGYLGLGMYEYYAGTLPGVVKFFSKLLMSGDAQKGLEYINLCRQKGFYNALGAKLLLIEIYTQPRSKYANTALAVKWSRELRAAYPVHPQMHFVEIVSLFEDKKYEESRKESLAYLKAISDGVPVYRRRYLPRVLTAIATTYLVEKKYPEAADYFARAAATIKEDPSLHPARWAVWAIVRQANVFDLMGNRAKAVEKYKEAKTFKDEWGFSEFIDNYLKKPFAVTDLPGSLPPP